MAKAQKPTQAPTAAAVQPRARGRRRAFGLAAPVEPLDAELRALLARLAKVRVTGLSDANHDRLAALGGDPSPLGRALRALMACVSKREELLERRMLGEQANLWAYIAALEGAGGRVPGRQGDRYRREQWRAFYGLVTTSAGGTGFSMWEPGASKMIAEHFAEAAKAGKLTSEVQAPGALVNIKLPHPAPLTPEEAVAFVGAQTGQSPRNAWRMLREVGTENLPHCPR